MPFKSKAQMRKFAEMVKNGQMTQSQFNEWAHATNFLKLPERVGPESHHKVGKIKSAKVIK